jgi:hypothetical protein
MNPKERETGVRMLETQRTSYSVRTLLTRSVSDSLSCTTAALDGVLERARITTHKEKLCISNQALNLSKTFCGGTDAASAGSSGLRAVANRGETFRSASKIYLVKKDS